MPVRYGLIGFGSFGSHAAEAIRNVRGAKLTAISARSDATCKKAAAAFGVDTHSNYLDLLKRNDIDAVHIATPNHLHRKIAVAALNHGKHVLLEKPMANNVSGCNAIIRAAKANKKILHIGFELRFSALCKKIKDLIEKGNIGKPKMALIELWRGPYGSGSGVWRLDPDKVGNWLLEQPVHYVDLACWYMKGKPVSVYARANSTTKKAGRLTENMSFFINYANGDYVVINQTLAAHGSRLCIKVVGTKGTLEADWPQGKSIFKLEHFNGKKVADVPISPKAAEKNLLEAEFRAMTKAINTGAGTDLATGIEGKNSVAICVAAEKSARQNRAIKMEI